MDSLKKQLKSFVSKKISVGGVGVAAGLAAQNDLVIYATMVYIVAQAAVDIVKVLKGANA